MSQEKILTPCIGVCSTGIGDSVCRGCKRFAHEVIGWNAYSNTERAFIIDRLQSLIAQIASNYVEVQDATILKAQLKAHKVRFNDSANPHSLAYEAIRAFGSRLPDLRAIGCTFRDGQQAMTITELKSMIDNDFYALSCAHYERYFPGHM